MVVKGGSMLGGIMRELLKQYSGTDIFSIFTEICKGKDLLTCKGLKSKNYFSIMQHE